ncbi:peptide-methionine (S)-S-oxide reductase MsrA [Hyphomicrobium sp. CS1BSMeth3]|uniref:peptide-methionine (S)-S-oxide reductase MsrA n=1 Tax=Hyphomicrobium sp. CS1BSMeth3 TaxID=1892844 RepID=UPI0009FB7BDC|nr:peptide-methionine (S)-S-oxide reductase MsrA [Hyphomicrobium sp. CS1BSMeth3]
MRTSSGKIASFVAGLLAAAFFMTAAVLAQAPSSEAEKSAKLVVATFAGGCFWCMEPPYDALDGVVSTTSGFMGGTTPNPTYQQVTAGGTGHIEVVQVLYDPTKVTYEKLLDVYWRNVDPYDAGGQFCDRGESYTTAIFTHTPEQKKLAEASKAALAVSGPFKQPIATVVRDAGPFTPAEDYHQNYYVKNPLRYKYYRYRCGRDDRLEAIWGKPTQ